MEKFDKYTVLIGRILLALVFIAGGASKIADGGAGTIPYMESMGIPGFLFWPTALFELLAGLAVLVGYQAKMIGMLLAGFCIVTALMAHSNFADQMQMILFMKNLAMAGGFMMLMRFGAGEFSMDNKAVNDA